MVFNRVKKELVEVFNSILKNISKELAKNKKAISAFKSA